MTKFHKKVFPAFCFGYLAIFLTVGVLTGAPLEDPMSIVFIVAPIAMGVVGFILMRKLVWDLVDEIYDLGDHLEDPLREY
jgi:hypothetical protein